ncbi:SaV-like [uncultured Caudovirales phage]|uniref:SaV-like n=1 Tax=uncultured Caudovirales phage TaxID=2100421 RepID=A0A6J5KL39_9CAUD|nr:SaV-like [uncultured Caudovirales phage]CAB4123731.1 SaV-like [uncultured Caudovirales phage]
MTDSINPSHYRHHPSGVECIAITEHLNFCLGNAMKYIWRAGLKTANPTEDLQKAKWYIEREIARLTEQK